MDRGASFSDCEFHGFSLSLVTLTCMAKPLYGLYICRDIAASLHQLTTLSLKSQVRISGYLQRSEPGNLEYI